MKNLGSSKSRLSDWQTHYGKYALITFYRTLGVLELFQFLPYTAHSSTYSIEFMQKHFSHYLEAFLFGSRWLQAPLYLGLVFAQGVYVFKFLQELIHLVSHAVSLSEIDIMLIVLGLIDVAMVANLLIMVIIGGYYNFFSRLNLGGDPAPPEWVSPVNASFF